ncbi:MAG: MCE family protein [Flavobacteriales bacterium]|nr:MCE family protein [Flavobacteriales bacterium]
MPRTSEQSLRLGLFVLAGTAVLVIGLYLLGSKRDLFSRTITVEAVFQQVGGLRPGNNVRYMGINVGTVKDIAITSDTTVRVRLAIREEAAGHIRSNAVATVGTDGLMGNRLVNLAPGEGEGAPLAEDVVLPSSVPLDTDLMLRTLDRTNANLAAITDDVRELAARLNTKGNAVDLLADTVLAHDLGAALREIRIAAGHARAATAGIDALMGDVREGKGVLGTLVGDPASEQQVRGLLGNLRQVSDSLHAATEGINRFAEALNTPGGMAHTLTADTLLTLDLRRTLSRLDTGSALLNEDLRALQRNWFFRGYFKDKEKVLKRGTRTRP